MDKASGFQVEGAGRKREEGICLVCGEPALAKCYSEAGKREVRITGICEVCFDSIVAVEE